MAKIDKMRREAKKQLAQKQSSSKRLDTEEDKPPSFLSGFLLIFAGSLVFSFAFSAGQGILGLFGGGAFVLIGMTRIAKSVAANDKEKSLNTDN